MYPSGCSFCCYKKLYEIGKLPQNYRTHLWIHINWIFPNVSNHNTNKHQLCQNPPTQRSLQRGVVSLSVGQHALSLGPNTKHHPADGFPFFQHLQSQKMLKFAINPLHSMVSPSNFQNFSSHSWQWSFLSRATALLRIVEECEAPR